MDDIEMKKLPSGYRCNDCKWCGSSSRVMCPKCGSTGLTTEEVSGEGKVVDFVPVLYPPEDLKDLGQYLSIMVQFHEGFRMFGIYTGKADQIEIGSSVIVTAYDEKTKRILFDSI